MKRKAIKLAISAAVMLWGLVSVIFLAGEPVEEMTTLSEFVVVKLAGLASLLLCIKAASALERRGYMIEFENDKEEQPWS